MASISFHIRDGANPEWCYQYLDIIEQYPDVSSGKEAYQKAKDYGYELGLKSEREVPTILKKMGVLSTATSLTERGEELVEVMYRDMKLFKNVLHHLFYAQARIETADEVSAEDRSMSAWTYATIVEYLIENSPYEGVSLKNSRQEIANAVYDTAETTFPSITDEISVGPRSVSGALQFLSELNPAVIERGTHTNNETVDNFSLRRFAPGEMLLLALNTEYQVTDTDYGTPLLLTSERIRNLCRQLVLDESGFEKVLNWAAEFDQFEVVTGVKKQVRLSNRVALDEVV